MFTNPVHVAELAAVLGAIAIVLVRWLPGRARRTATTLAGASVVLTALAVFLFGARWQMYPVLVAALIALAFAMPTIVGTRTGRRARRAPWWLALPGSLACLALIVAGGGAAWALPVPAFPQPSGGFTVGTTTLQWTDADRDEPETPDPADHRTIVAQLWYPAESATGDADPAPYLGRTQHEADIVSAGVADYLGVPAFVLDSASRASTHSFTDVAPARETERFPLVLFSPGLGGVRGQNTVWAEERASRGYVVIALDHPYDSAAVVLDDGRTVRTRVSATGDAAEDEKRAVSWTATRAADLSFALTRLGELDRGRIKNPFTARLDTSRVAVTGHSLGGAAALRAARQDPASPR